MDKPGGAPAIEARWPVVITVLLTLCVLRVLPGRLWLLPAWFAYACATSVLVPMAAVWLTHGREAWLRIERTILLLFILIMASLTLTGLASLIRVIVGRSAPLNGMQLLTSSIAVWICNVLLFSLLFWQMDRGGPEARANRMSRKPDWQFPQTSDLEGAPEGWRPTFIDYLLLAYTTATAFSPADVLPMTSRAKLLIMLESTIALITLVVVASRAINTLGG